MILNKGNTGYWAVGITVTWNAHAYGYGGQWKPGWRAEFSFYDDGFGGKDVDADHGHVSTGGTLSTRYFIPDGETTSGLSAAVDAILNDAKRLGIEFTHQALYYKGDGEDENFPPPPDWRRALAVEADRIGFHNGNPTPIKD